MAGRLFFSPDDRYGLADAKYFRMRIAWNTFFSPLKSYFFLALSVSSPQVRVFSVPPTPSAFVVNSRFVLFLSGRFDSSLFVVLDHFGCTENFVTPVRAPGDRRVRFLRTR